MKTKFLQAFALITFCSLLILKDLGNFYIEPINISVAEESFTEDKKSQAANLQNINIYKTNTSEKNTCLKAEKLSSIISEKPTEVLENAETFEITETFAESFEAAEEIPKSLAVEKIVFYNEINSLEPAGSLSPQTVKVIAREGDWYQIETWEGPKWINLKYIKPEVFLDVPSYNQRALGYPTGCEIVSLSMMINSETFVDVSELAAKMPLSTDPNKGYRGNPRSYSGFTIFPQALLSLTEEYLKGAEDLTGKSLEDLKIKLSEGHPVVAWINGLGFNVHAICLTGYDESGFYYNDPWSGGKDVYIDYDSFYKIWNEPIYDGWHGIYYPPRKALSYNGVYESTLENVI